MGNKGKINLQDLTILIPVRVDSIARLENLCAVVRYLRYNFYTKIIILEADAYNNKITERLMSRMVEYIYVKDEDPIFYRTYYLNMMAKMVRTDYLALWDADVLVPPGQVRNAVFRLRSKNCDVVFPYDGRFLDTTPIIRNLYLQSEDIAFLESHEGKMLHPYGDAMHGGAILVNTQKYILAGMENENFYGWGPEDWERFERWKTLGYNIITIKGVLYHLSHPRNINGMHSSDFQKRNAYYELNTIKKSSMDEIKFHLNLLRSD